MLKNVKSSYHLKNIFSFVNETIKLQLLKYNKNLQKEMDLNILNYRLFSKRYIIYETKGKGKEYTISGYFIFEGEYLNGERNGKG